MMQHNKKFAMPKRTWLGAVGTYLLVFVGILVAFTIACMLAVLLLMAVEWFFANQFGFFVFICMAVFAAGITSGFWEYNKRV